LKFRKTALCTARWQRRHLLLKPDAGPAVLRQGLARPASTCSRQPPGCAGWLGDSAVDLASRPFGLGGLLGPVARLLATDPHSAQLPLACAGAGAQIRRADVDALEIAITIAGAGVLVRLLRQNRLVDGQRPDADQGDEHDSDGTYRHDQLRNPR